MSGGESRSRTYVPIALFVALALTVCAPVASASDKLYWSNYDDSSISVMNMDGSGGASDLYTTGAPRGGEVAQPAGLTINPASNKIYWASTSSNSIVQGSLDGCASSDVCASKLYPLGSGGPTVDTPNGLAVDPTNNWIYWQGNVGGTGSIVRANLDGSGGETTVNIAGAMAFSGGQSGGLVIDSLSNRIYWTNFMWGAISSASLTGSGASDINLHSANNDGPFGLAIDRQSNKVYWATQNGLAGGRGSISWAYLDGSDGGDLYSSASPSCSGLNHPNGIAIDASNNKVYWGNYSGSTVMAANLDGSGGCTVLNSSGASTAGPDEVVLLKAPGAAGAPTVSGSGSASSPLICSEGTWAKDTAESNLFRAPREISYQWVRDGAVVSGATGSSFVPGASGSYTCTATATNAAGATAQTSSNSVSIAATTQSTTTSTSTATSTTASSTAPTIKVKRPGIADCVRVSSRKATFSIPYVLSEAASVKGKLLTKSRSASTVSSCKTSKPTGGSDRFRTIRKITTTGVAGKNKLRIKMTSGGKALPPGRYRLRLQATNSKGVVSTASTVSFLLVVKPR